MDSWDRITEELPGWVVPEFDAVQECYRVACRLAHAGMADQRDRGVLGALVWLVLGEAAPVTHRTGWPVTREAARGESWVALCVAARMLAPTARDWRRLAVAPLPARTEDQEYAYGAWRAVAWLLGVREDWPIQGAWHRAAGIAPERPHLLVPPHLQGTPAWRAADQASREQAATDARRYWWHVRRLADATDRASGQVSDPVGR